jgi:hypothetical protein
MASMPILLRVFAGLLFISLVFPRPAYAYLDPMSGSIILQALAAGILAALLMFKRFWYHAADRCRRIWQRLLH